MSSTFVRVVDNWQALRPSGRLTTVDIALHDLAGKPVIVAVEHGDSLTVHGTKPGVTHLLRKKYFVPLSDGAVAQA